jgi:hypothetical protein
VKCEGFTPAEPVRLWHRLALVDLQIRWDSDGADDALLGILPVFSHFLHEQATSAAYDFSLCLRMIGDDHPALRPVCYPLARRFSKLGLGR